jgi:hypothetical protein
MPNQDISRWLLQTRKHYAAARLQQGRVLLDSDPNDAGNLGAEQRRRVLVDVFGPKGSRDEGFSIRQTFDGTGGQPAPIQKNDQFQAVGVSFNGGPEIPTLPLSIGAGSIYLGGMRLDMDVPESVVFQRDFLQLVVPPASPPPPPTAVMLPFAQNFRWLYYLYAWEQGVSSSVEDQEVGEPMLRGPDSSFRIRRMRRVQVFDVSPTSVTTCNDAWQALVAQLVDNGDATFDERGNELVSAGRLQLVFKGGEAEDTCSPPDLFQKRYLGAENQALRVLLTSDTTFVWALDNGTPIFRVELDDVGDPVDGVTVTILNPPRDERSMPFQNRVVEILPWTALLDGGQVPGADPQLRKVAADVGVFTRVSGPYDPVKHTFKLELAGSVQGDLQDLVQEWDQAHPFAADLNVVVPGGKDERFFYMRLWHEAPTAADVQLTVTNDPTAAALGDTGIVPVFKHHGQAGDFWVATLRVDKPTRIQPYDFVSDDGVPPTGPRRFFGPLALIAGEAVPGTTDTTQITNVQDCRPRIRPLADRGCTTLIVGDGVHSFGDFQTIQDALAALPDEGGVISVRPGIYSGPITITGPNVTLEGCGDATVIQSSSPTPNGLVSINGATNTRMSGFKLIAADERAVLVSLGSHLVDLGALHIVSGTVDQNGVFSQFGHPAFPQVDFTNASDVSLHDSLLEPNRQTGVHVAAARVTMTGLELLGTHSAEDNDAPLVWVDTGATDVAIRDSVLDARGQQGVNVTRGAQRVELAGLSIAVHIQDVQLPGGTPQRVAAARPAVNIDAVGSSFDTAVTLRRCRIVVDATRSEYAAVVAGGSAITIEDNVIETLDDATTDLPLAWGGVQVLSGSTKVRIAGNQITGGYGHGITLGDVLWVAGDDVLELRGFLAQGAGAGQTGVSGRGGSSVTGSLTFMDLPDPNNPDPDAPKIRFFATFPNGAISDVVIADNRITRMATNGISMITVLGFDDGTLPEVDSLRIEGNVISSNLRDLFQNVTTFPALPLTASTLFRPLDIPVLPFGGIVLATAIDTQIRNNDVTANAVSVDALPINGIFVLDGDALEIEGNRVLANSLDSHPGIPSVRTGPRAGITVLVAGSGAPPDGALDGLVGVLTPPTDLDNGGFSLRVTNNTVDMPQGRALLALGMGPMHIQGNYLTSHANSAGDAPSEQFQVGDLVYVQNLGAPWETFEFDPNDVRLEPGNSSFDIPNLLKTTLAVQNSDSPYRYIGLGGALGFNNNHTILDWNVTRPPTEPTASLAYFPVALLTLDSLEVLGNQMALRIQGVPTGLPPPIDLPNPVSQPVLAHMLGLGITVKIELNRFSENVASVLLSLMARGDLLNSTSFNQSTHQIYSVVPTHEGSFFPKSIEQRVNNQILFLPPDFDSVTNETLRANLKTLFGLLFPLPPQ